MVTLRLLPKAFPPRRSPGPRRWRPVAPLLPLLWLLAVSVCPLPAGAASWEEVLQRYHACRQRQADVGSTLDTLRSELGQPDLLPGAEGGEGRAALDGFLRGLRERGDAARDGLRRMPGLLEEIDAQIEKYGDSRTCPECIESSTFLLCATVEELVAEAEGCLEALGILRAHWAGELSVAAVLRRCRERLSAVRERYEAAGALPEVESELGGVAGALDEAASALEDGRPTQGLVRALEARQVLGQLARYLDGPP